jgi:Zn-dependent protease with chaperone function
LLGANAFALPGGHMVITDDLVTLLKDQPDAIVGVLAHELGHVQHRDGLDMLVRSSLISAIFGIVLGDSSGFFATIPATLVTQSYSRDAESRADAFAAQTLHKAGVSPAVMAVFFERLLKEEGSPSPEVNEDAKANKTTSPPTRGEDTAQTPTLPIAISSHPEHEARIRFFKEWKPQP